MFADARLETILQELPVLLGLLFGGASQPGLNIVAPVAPIKKNEKYGSTYFFSMVPPLSAFSS